MARGIASRAFCLLGFATRRTPRTAAAPARDTMEPAAKKARGGGGDDDAARLAPQQSKTARTVDNADLKAWQYNVIAWKSCEDFAERLHASDPERFQYRETVWEKFDDSKKFMMDGMTHLACDETANYLVIETLDTVLYMLFTVYTLYCV